MPAVNLTKRFLLAAALSLAAAAAPVRAAETRSFGSTDEVRSWAAIQRMKAMEVMHLIDAEKKGYVTREEFMTFQEHLFQSMDRNGDGKVDAQEWMGKGASAATAKK